MFRIILNSLSLFLLDCSVSVPHLLRRKVTSILAYSFMESVGVHQAKSIMTNMGQQRDTAWMGDSLPQGLAMDLEMELVLGKLLLIMFISCHKRFIGQI